MAGAQRLPLPGIFLPKCRRNRRLVVMPVEEDPALAKEPHFDLLTNLEKNQMMAGTGQEPSWSFSAENPCHRCLHRPMAVLFFNAYLEGTFQGGSHCVVRG